MGRIKEFVPGESKKILIVEDSPSQSAIIASIVEQAGHQPVVYNQLPVGISQILDRESPDLVLLDLRLLDEDGKPAADGFQVCREIKSSPENPPVIVVTAETDDDAFEWALLQGADAFLQKPFAPEDLTQVIGEVLGA